MPAGSLNVTVVLAPDTTKLLPEIVTGCAPLVATKPDVMAATWGFVAAAETVKLNHPESPPPELVTFTDQVPGVPRKFGLAVIDEFEIVGAPATQHGYVAPVGSRNVTVVLAPETTKLVPEMATVWAPLVATKPDVMAATWGFVAAAETVKLNHPESPPPELVTFTDQVPGVPRRFGLAAIDVLETVGAPAMQQV